MSVATKKKYVSEFEIRSNINEAYEQLKKTHSEWSKMPTTVDSFSKALNGSIKLSSKFSDMMTAVPKAIRHLTELSKLEFMPRKELDKISDSIQLVMSAAKGLGGNNFDPKIVKPLINEFEKALLSLQDIEESHRAAIDYTREYNKILSGTNTLYKSVNEKSENFKKTSKTVSDQFGVISVEVARIGNQLKSAQRSGKLNEQSMRDYRDRLKEATNSTEILVKEQEVAAKKIETVFSAMKNVLSSVSEVSRSMENNSVVKSGYENNIAQIKTLKDELEKVVTGPEADREDGIQRIKSKFNEHLESIETAIKLNERLGSEEKTVNDAINLMSRLSAEVKEELSSMTNPEIVKLFKQANVEVERMQSELVQLIAVGKQQGQTEQEHNDIIRQKMGLLKTEADKLRELANRQLDINQLERESLSATVKRAREQNNINEAYIKQTLLQKGNLAGMYDAMKVAKDNIPNKLMTTFGENGVAAGKMISGAFKGLTAIIAPFSAGLMAMGAVKMMFELEKQVKGARKQLLYMAADTHTAGSAFEDIRHGGQLANGMMESMRKQTEQWSWSLGISMEQANTYMKDFTAKGFRAVSALNELESMMGISAFLGMELSDVTSRAGDLRSEFKMNLTDIGGAFVDMQGDAKNAGISTSIFFDKVINAATGLGLYGKKIEDVSALFSGLVKNMKLPEKAATDASSKIVGGFKDMSMEMQIATYRFGSGSKVWEKSYKQRSEAIKSERSQLDESEKSIVSQYNAMDDATKASEGFMLQEKLVAIRAKKEDLAAKQRNLDSIDRTKNLSGEMLKARNLDPANEFLMRMSAIANKTGFDISGNIESVDATMSKSFLKMEKVAGLFGMGREEITAMKHLSENLLFNSQSIKKAFGKEEAKGIIGVLSESTDIATRSIELEKKFAKIDKQQLTGIKDVLKEQFPSMADEFDRAIGKDGQITAKGLADVVAKLDVNFKSLTNEQEVISKAKAKSDARFAGIEALKQTKSTEDALTNTVGVWLRKLFTIFEKFVGMFSFVFSGKLKDFSTLSDSLYKNSDSVEALKQQIGQQQTGVKIQIDQTEKALSESKDEGEKKILTEKLGVLNKKSTELNSMSNDLNVLSDTISATRRETEATGKVPENFDVTNEKINSGINKVLTGINKFNELEDDQKISSPKFSTLKTSQKQERSPTQGVNPSLAYGNDKGFTPKITGEIIISAEDKLPAKGILPVSHPISTAPYASSTFPSTKGADEATKIDLKMYFPDEPKTSPTPVTSLAAWQTGVTGTTQQSIPSPIPPTQPVITPTVTPIQPPPTSIADNSTSTKTNTFNNTFNISSQKNENIPKLISNINYQQKLKSDG